MYVCLALTQSFHFLASCGNFSWHYRLTWPLVVFYIWNYKCVRFKWSILFFFHGDANIMTVSNYDHPLISIESSYISGVSTTQRRQCGFLPRLGGLQDWIWKSCRRILARYNLYFVTFCRQSISDLFFCRKLRWNEQFLCQVSDNSVKSARRIWTFDSQWFSMFQTCLTRAAFMPWMCCCMFVPYGPTHLA